MPVGLGRTLETQGELCGDIHNIITCTLLASCSKLIQILFISVVVQAQMRATQNLGQGRVLTRKLHHQNRMIRSPMRGVRGRRLPTQTMTPRILRVPICPQREAGHANLVSMTSNRCNKLYNIVNRLNLDNKNEIIFEK